MIHPDMFQRLTEPHRAELLREAEQARLAHLAALQARDSWWRSHVALGLAQALVTAGTRLQQHYRPVANECVTC